jgi:outer membrane receptor protein involved in Fe transport
VAKGKHSLKFGVNFHKDDVTDYSPGIGTIGRRLESLTDFFNGVSDNYSQNFSVRPTQPIAIYGLGFYAQDEWAIRSNLKLTLALRADHNSNPTCLTNCFARFSDSFQSISHDVNQPYNQAIVSGQHQVLPNYTAVEWLPRFGFTWTPFGSGRNTVIRGGFDCLRTCFQRRLPIRC